MSENLKKIGEEFNNLKGQFVISGYSVYRLIGILDDTEDYYYALYDGRKIEYHSCVGRIFPLKGYLRESDYQEMIRIAGLNHYDQIDLPANQNHKDSLIKQLSEKDVFIEGPYWDLN